MLKTLFGAMMESSPKRVPIPRNGVDYRGKVVLAPMVRSGELPARLTALHYGADLVWGPETIDKAIIGCTRKFDPITNTITYSRMATSNKSLPPEQQKESILYRIHPEKEKGKLIYQVGTANAELAVQAGKTVAADVAGIDVNSGCPKPFSTHAGMGAALLRTPDLLCSILTALVKEVGQVYEIGISVKIRLLSTADETRALVERLVRTGITGLTIHCRTTPMRPREAAIREQLSMIADICREAGVACVMNGDVPTREGAYQLMKEYGADGAMIATAAEADPSVFRCTTDGGKAPWREITYEYMKNAIGIHNRLANTKFSLAQIMPGKLDVSKKVAQYGKTYTQIIDFLGFEDLAEAALEADKRVGLMDRVNALEQTKKTNKSAIAAGKSALSTTKGRKPLSTRGVGTAKALVSAQPVEVPEASLATA